MSNKGHAFKPPPSHTAAPVAPVTPTPSPPPTPPPPSTSFNAFAQLAASFTKSQVLSPVCISPSSFLVVFTRISDRLQSYPSY